MPPRVLSSVQTPPRTESAVALWASTRLFINALGDAHPREKLEAPGTVRVGLGKERLGAVPGAPVSPPGTGQGSGDQPSKGIPFSHLLAFAHPGKPARPPGNSQPA